MRHSRLFTLLFFAFLMLSAGSSPICAGEENMTGIDAVLVLDISGSMMKSDPGYLCREASSAFIESLSSCLASRTAIITFSDRLDLSTSLCALDSDSSVAALKDRLESISYTRGDTDIGLAVQSAKELLMLESAPERAKCILLLTDGEIDLPKAPDEKNAENESLTKALVTVEDARKSGIVIHTVMLDPSGTLDASLCRYMADKTGGYTVCTANAADLPDIFRTIYNCAREQAIDLAAAIAPETEAETESVPQTEVVSETESETETEAAASIIAAGSVDSPVILRGLIPGMCTAKLNLSDLFQYSSTGIYDYGNAGMPSMDYHVISSAPSVECGTEDGILLLKGASAGTSTITVYASPSEAIPFSGSDSIRFDVSVDPVFSSVRSAIITSAAAAAALLAGILMVLIIRFFLSDVYLTGSLQWYVKGENEKIYGVPSQTLARLEGYGKKAYLSELIDDELLEGCSLSRVTLRGTKHGIQIHSRTKDILILGQGSQPSRTILLAGSARFSLLCRSSDRNVTVFVQYTAAGDTDGYKKADTSEERTRMLITPERKAG